MLEYIVESRIITSEDRSDSLGEHPSQRNTNPSGLLLPVRILLQIYQVVQEV